MVRSADLRLYEDEIRSVEGPGASTGGPDETAPNQTRRGILRSFHYLAGIFSSALFDSVRVRNVFRRSFLTNGPVEIDVLKCEDKCVLIHRSSYRVEKPASFQASKPPSR